MFLDGNPRFTIVSIERIQNLNQYVMYNAKKQAISQKVFGKYNAPYNLTSEDLKEFGIDENLNEFYMWHYAPNIDEIKKGTPLKKPIDVN